MGLRAGAGVGVGRASDRDIPQQPYPCSSRKFGQRHNKQPSRGQFNLGDGDLARNLLSAKAAPGER